MKIPTLLLVLVLSSAVSTMTDGADFTGAKFQRATLHDARFRKAKLPGVEIHLAGVSPSILPW